MAKTKRCHIQELKNMWYTDTGYGRKFFNFIQ